MRRTAKGFTLVEIMIVVAIIGILIAIAVPGFLRAREVSRRNSCQENQTKLDGALQQYIIENKVADVAAAETWVETGQTAPGDTTWTVNSNGGEGVLVGEREYIRFPPECPSGGLYEFVWANESAGIPPVACSLSVRTGANSAFEHDYPVTGS